MLQGGSAMKLVDESFFRPRIPVAVIDCGATGEALLVRGLLENMNAIVLFHQPGTPSDFLLLLAEGDRAPRFIVICAHGDGNGIILGSFASNVDASVLVDGSLPPAALSGRINLPGCVVLSTACMTGMERFATAFLKGGVSAYIAATEYPEGAGVLLFVHHFFHEVLCHGLSPQAAYARANSCGGSTARFSLHPQEHQR
jgi:hypothetical protein